VTKRNPLPKRIYIPLSSYKTYISKFHISYLVIVIYIPLSSYKTGVELCDIKDWLEFTFHLVHIKRVIGVGQDQLPDEFTFHLVHIKH